MQIIIIGSGKVGSALASELDRQGHEVVIVDSSLKMSENVDKRNFIKIYGVPIDREVLRQAGIETADVLCAVMQNDNINIMVAQIADQIFHVPQIIARIFDPANREVFETFNINTVCQTELTVQAILRRIAGERQEEQHRVYNANILYSRVPVAEEFVGEEICDLATDTDKVVFGLIRKGKLQLALPGLMVQDGDELVLAAVQN